MVTYGLALVRCLTVGPPGLWPGFGPGDPPTLVCEAGAGILKYFYFSFKWTLY